MWVRKFRAECLGLAAGRGASGVYGFLGYGFRVYGLWAGSFKPMDVSPEIYRCGVHTYDHALYPKP